jgi:two-component system sensor histidine kinase and response regulator WspE
MGINGVGFAGFNLLQQLTGVFKKDRVCLHGYVLDISGARLDKCGGNGLGLVAVDDGDLQPVFRPFADGLRGFPRLVRDVSRQLGKWAQLEISGQNTPVDRDVLEKLEAPLNHIIRNALDHGLEPPQERLAAGKSESGKILLEARHRAGMLLITIADDGRGINLEVVRRKVVERGLADPAMADQLSETELIDFLLLPGFSTAEKVTDISGRGVGLDVAQSALQEIGGSLQVAARAGGGTQFHLQSPLTLSVVRTLLAQIAGRPFAFPLTRIDQVIRLSRSEIHTMEDRQHFMLDEQSIGLMTAHQLLELATAPQLAEEIPVIVLSDRFNRYGLAVDGILGERELVVRPLDPRLGKVPNISAAALLDDGEPMLVADVEDMVRSIDHLVADGRLDKVGRAATTRQKRTVKRILVVDDSITVREVERKLLENRGCTVDVAVDGVDGWNAVRTRSYDIVVSDVDMPRMTGIEFIKQIRQDAELRGLPVLIVSYKDREEDRLLGMEAGANYYLTKSSFADETLLQAVEDLIGEA